MNAYSISLQTLAIAPKFEELAGLTLSYGPCQIPTLGFVVDRYNRIETFEKEKFWTIQMTLDVASNSNTGTSGSTLFGTSSSLLTNLEIEDLDEEEDEEEAAGNSTAIVNRAQRSSRARYSDVSALARAKAAGNAGESRVQFSWTRGRLFDHLSAYVLYERCVEAQSAVVTRVSSSPETRKPPVPMSTLALQTAASKYLKLPSDKCMSEMDFSYGSLCLLFVSAVYPTSYSFFSQPNQPL